MAAAASVVIVCKLRNNDEKPVRFKNICIPASMLQ